MDATPFGAYTLVARMDRGGETYRAMGPTGGAVVVRRFFEPRFSAEGTHYAPGADRARFEAHFAAVVRHRRALALPMGPVPLALPSHSERPDTVVPSK